MYTQGSHNPQPGQGPQKPMSSLYQQPLPGPPLPLPKFQQGPSGFTSYQHGPAAPHQIPLGGLPNTGQSYLHPPVHVHGAAPLPHMYFTAQQNSQHHSHLATQNAHNMPQPVLPSPISAPHPEVSQTQPPSRALPPPPPPPPQSQGQTFYRAPVNLPPQQPGLKHISSHPPLPLTTSFFTSAPLGNFIHSSGGDHHVLSTSTLPPPPPLSSPPPSLPSPPPSTSTPFSSSKPVQNASNLPCNLYSDGSKLSASGFVDEVSTPIQVKHNLVADNGSLNMGGGNGCDMGSLVGDKLSLQEGLTMDLSSTPPKPTDENVIKKIEALCQYIAKNGPDYEDMVRKNESGNPEYSFLYGGEPGSEAAVAHDFFWWMKKKSILVCKSDKQQEDSSLRPSENKPSEQPCHLVIAAASHSLDDSDMEMEDDITQIDDDQGMNHSSEGLNSQFDINDSMLNVKEQIHPLQIPAECNAHKGILSEKESASGSSRLGEQGPEGITNADQMEFGASVSKVVLVKLTVPTAHSLVTSLGKSNTSGQLAKDGSPFRLLQDYASDDNSEKDVETCMANTSVSFGSNLGRDAGSSLENATSPCQIEKGFVPLSLSSMPCAVASSEVVEGTITTSIIRGNEHADNKHIHQVSINHAASGEVLQKENVMVDASVDSVKFSKEHRQEGENLTLSSTQHKVDKFGRLARNGASDSDSDDLRYLGRHKGDRTRSRSQSCSPPDRRRRRSPWRRRKKRSLSRSWSPRNRRSRSRSPRNRRSRSRSLRNRRRRSRSPRNQRSRSRSPRNRRSRSRSPRNRRSRRICINCPKKKLLVLDLNGILVDVIQNPGEFQPDIKVSGKGVFKRPFCDDFLQFCFRTFNVGIWSSRTNKNVCRLVSFLMRKWRHNLLFCWHRKQCTITKLKTIEDKQKPLVLKELRKLWEKHLPNLPWEKGEYDESNTLLLDDSPYKALRNPANTAVFPYPYQYRDAEDSSLGRGGDIRKYLEGLAAAENVQKYVEQNPFGQPAITESNPHWDFYCQIIEDKT